MEKIAILGQALSGLVEHAWKVSGPETALALIREANIKEHPVKIRWVWLDDLADPPYAPQVPPEKLGKVREGKSLSLTIKIATGDAFRFTYVPVATDIKRPGMGGPSAHDPDYGLSR